MAAERVLGVKLRLEEVERKKYTWRRVPRESVTQQGQREGAKKPNTSTKGATLVGSLNPNPALHVLLGPAEDPSSALVPTSPGIGVIEDKPGMAEVSGHPPYRLERPSLRHSPKCSQGLGTLDRRNFRTPLTDRSGVRNNLDQIYQTNQAFGPDHVHYQLYPIHGLG